MVVCLERDADLHTAQMIPLPLTVSCFSKIQIGLFWYRLTWVDPEKGPLNARVCVYVAVNSSVYLLATSVVQREQSVWGPHQWSAVYGARVN